MGMAQAGLFPCAIIGLRDWQPIALSRGQRDAFYVHECRRSISTALGRLAPDQLQAWREAFVWLSVPGIVWAAWYFLWYRNRPDEHSAANVDELRLISPQQRLPIPRRISNHERRGCDCSSTIGCG